MKTIVLQTAAAALIAASLAPVASFAQSRAAAGTDPYAPAQRAPVCTQLELSVGLQGDECGVYSLSELAFIKADQDGTL